MSKEQVVVRRRKVSVSTFEAPSLEAMGKAKPRPADGSRKAQGTLARLDRRHTMEPMFDPDPLGLAMDIEPSKAALAPSGMLGQGRALFGAATRRPAGTDADGRMCQMALKYRLMLPEVKRIMQEFTAAPRNADAALDHKEFAKVMAKIFDVDAVDEVVSKGAYRASGMQHKMDIEPFLEWYVQNMFTQVNTLNTDKSMKDSEALVYELAKKHQVSPLVIDKVKVKFDYYDGDGSGEIDYSEFQAMFCALLKTNPETLNAERMKKFWREIDNNGDGGVCFSEFTQWYLKYFNVDTSDDPEDFDMAGPLRAYYDSYNPSVQRSRQSKDGLTKHASIN